MPDGGRWRRFYSLWWYLEAFQRLTDPERVVFVYLLTCPQSTSVGIYRISTALAVEDIGNLTAVEFDFRLSQVCAAFGWRFDSATRVLWIPTWIADNPPQSPNVCKSWRKLLTNVPDCDLKLDAADAIFQALKDMPKGFSEAFGNLPKDLRNSKAKPKALPESNQGSGDQGIQRSGKQRTGALRAVAMNGVNVEWLGIARDVVTRYGHLNEDELIDHFYFHGRPKAEKAKRVDIIAALNIALAETTPQVNRLCSATNGSG